MSATEDLLDALSGKSPVPSMTLRDHFAAQVLPAIFTFYATAAANGANNGEVKYADLTDMAYDIADKMLARREK